MRKKKRERGNKRGLENRLYIYIGYKHGRPPIYRFYRVPLYGYRILRELKHLNYDYYCIKYE